MGLIHNEQVKLTATWLNGIAIAAIAVGGIAPFTAAILGTTSVLTAVLSVTIWFGIGSAIHWRARMMLRRLIE